MSQRERRRERQEEDEHNMQQVSNEMGGMGCDVMHGARDVW